MDQRVCKGKRRAFITERSYVATRQGIEPMMRQLQCRMKRGGQFWSTTGDDAILCLETFWRNDRWKLLFPHGTATHDFSPNQSPASAQAAPPIPSLDSHLPPSHR